MKRHFLCLTLLCLLLPVLALAAPAHMPYDASLCISYTQLNSRQQQVFDCIYDALYQHKTSVELPKNTRFSDANDIARLVLSDCPELYGADNSWSVEYRSNAPDVATSVRFTYSGAESNQKALLQKARETAATFRGDAYTVEKAIHDFLCRHIVYTENSTDIHNAYGALCRGKAVCEGYAESAALLLRLCGIPASVVTGGNHAWNIVRIGKSYTLLDVTYDDQSEIIYTYFNLTDREMNIDHRPERGVVSFPACTDGTLSYYEKEGLLLPGSKGECEKALYRLIRERNKWNNAITVKFASQSVYNKIAGDLNGLLEGFNKAYPDQAFYGSYSYMKDDDHQILTLYFR